MTPPSFNNPVDGALISAPAAHGSIQGCLEACTQCREVVASLKPGQYGAAANGESSIGGHMRHCLDHFLCFFRGLEDGEINYDARERNITLETDPTAFFSVLDEVCAALRKLDAGDLSRLVPLRQLPAPARPPITVNTTIDRELLFLMSHCIHHLALVSMLAKQLGSPIPANVGIAYSTAEYRKGLEAGNR